MKSGAVKQKGFTLVEAMVVVAIIGILAAIAFPIYNRESMKNRRTEAISAATRIANELQAYFSDNNFSYTGYGISSAVSNNLRWYNAAVVTPTATTYTITVTPLAGSVQADDTDCAAFTLDEKGVKGNTGTETVTARCWSTN